MHSITIRYKIEQCINNNKDVARPCYMRELIDDEEYSCLQYESCLACPIHSDFFRHVECIKCI